MSKKFTFMAENIDEKLWIEHQEVYAKLIGIQNELKSAMYHTTHWESIKMIMKKGYGSISGTPVWNKTGFDIIIDIEDDKPKNKVTPNPWTYVDPKLVNSLIHGKLLTQAEKLKLLSKLLPEGILDSDKVKESKEKDS